MNKTLLLIIFWLSTTFAALGPQVINNQKHLDIEHLNIVLRNEHDQFINHADASIATASIAINYTNATDNEAVFELLKASGAKISIQDDRYIISGAFTLIGSNDIIKQFPWCMLCQQPRPDHWVGPAPCCKTT